MRAVMWYLAVALLLVTCGSVSSAPDTATITSSPLFAWSSIAYFVNAVDQTPRAENFEVHSSLHDTLEQLLRAFTDPDASSGSYGVDAELLQEQRPEVLMLVLGNQLRTSHLKSRVMQKSLQPLKALLDGSMSSLTVPYVLQEDTGVVSNYISKLERLAADMQLQTSVLNCGSGSAGSLDDALQQQGQRPQLVILCASPHTSGSYEEAVAAEVQQLQDAHDRVAALGKRQLTMYASAPDAAGSLPPRRQLQGVQADVGTCGQLCQTQVKWLEGILSALLLAIAAFSGMCCLYMLDTPTRFEKPKEGGRND